MSTRTGMSPCICRPGEQPRHGLCAETCSSLGNRARRYLRASSRQRQFETVYDVADPFVANQSHSNDQPCHLFGRQPSMPDGGGSSCLQCLLDPFRVEVLAKVSKIYGRYPTHILQRMLKSHAYLSTRSGPVANSWVILGDALATGRVDTLSSYHHRLRARWRGHLSLKYSGTRCLTDRHWG